MTEITLTNNLTGQEFYFSCHIVNYTQFYSRLAVLMEQLAIIEGISPWNISHTVSGLELAA